MPPLVRRLLPLTLALCGAAHGGGVAGTDTDHNGIRDDVDDYIAGQTPALSPGRAAAQEYAQALQALLAGAAPAATGRGPTAGPA